MTPQMAIAMGAGALLGGVHLSLFQRGVMLAFTPGRPALARVLSVVLGLMRFFLTAGAGFLLVRQGVSPLGMGVGMLSVLYLHRARLLASALKEGRV